MDSQAPRYAPRRRTRSQGVAAPALPLPVRRRAKSPCYGDKVRALCSEGQGGLLEWTRQLGVSSGGAIQNGYCLFISVNLMLGVTGRVARHNCGHAMNPDDAARDGTTAVHRADPARPRQPHNGDAHVTPQLAQKLPPNLRTLQRNHLPLVCCGQNAKNELFGRV